MEPIFDDDILKKGFCWGEHVRRVDDTGRLRLNKDIAGMLGEHGVSRLWRCPDPAGQRFVLCPPEYRETFIRLVRKRFEDSEELEDAWRLVCRGTESNIDGESRINIPQACLTHAGIKPPQYVRVLGFGLWFEVEAWTLQRGDECSGQ